MLRLIYANYLIDSRGSQLNIANLFADKFCAVYRDVDCNLCDLNEQGKGLNTCFLFLIIMKL